MIPWHLVEVVVGGAILGLVMGSLMLGVLAGWYWAEEHDDRDAA